MTDNSVIGSGEFRSTRDPRTGIIMRQTLPPTKVLYSALEGDALFEGDIILSSVEKMEKMMGALDTNEPPSVIEGIGIVGSGVRWPGGRIPFQIDPDLPNKARVTQAIEHWEQRTRIRFHQRTADDFDHIIFRVGSGPASAVGKQGGRQRITLSSDSTLGNTIHEIGHAVGLWHEQSREDRNERITIIWDNIEPDAKFNFEQQITDGDDIGDYDYGSIMHYSAFAFAIDQSQPTIVTPNGEHIGQREGLSEGDISAVRAMYPNI